MGLFAQLYQARWPILGAILLLYIASKVRTYMRLRQFKGPFSTGWSEVWHVRAILSLRSHEKYREVTDKYGPISRIGPNDLITTSPELLMQMNTVRSPYTRAAWYNRSSRVEVGKDHIFSLIDEDKHTKRRQQMSPGYSGKENLSLEPSIDGRVQDLVELIRSKYISTPAQTKPMDLARKFQYLALDVISLIGFGKTFGHLKVDSDVDNFIAATEAGFPRITLTCAIGSLPILQWPPIARLISPSENDKTGLGRMMAMFRRLVEDRLTTSTDKRSDMMASFMRHGLSKDEVITEAFLQIIAGSDTTATTMRSVMLYIISHPRVYKRLQAEIDHAVESGLLGSSAIISEAQAKTLPYLNAVIREGIRIHPPVTDIVPKVVPKEGDTVSINGESIFLPGGTNIGYCVLGLNRSKALFGDDVDLFRPERWLVEDDKDSAVRIEAMKRTTEMMFGYGKYQCLGKPIAWMEINKALFELMRHFDWAIERPEKPWTSANYIGIFFQRDMWVTITEREPGHSYN
ncbi:benzoate 4-monooxygenase cytochrome-like protein P450 [Polyplosphaeria fusca]|uniref:Cytochrome P450 monooxygenase ABA1 n=1 Tax=Polyplosphaeria fusca TaxID=682080 RepID=A0A9P4UWF6_9PLEO|nr:benzoate 4-monooxygenase cytochrome-like protein P450 [Polyplosphaeria fusca]